MSFKKISAEVIQIHKKDLQKYLAMNTYEGQRRLREKRVRELTWEMNNQTFRTGEIGVAKLTYDNDRRVIVNGQHTLHSFEASSLNVLEVCLEKFICNTPQDLAELYRKYDTGGTRSIQNMLTPESIALGATWSSRTSGLIIAAAAIKEGMRDANKQTKVELLKTYLNFGRFLSNLIHPKDNGINSKHLQRVAVVYPILATWERCEDDAGKFWTRVRDGENLTADMPEYKIRDYLLTASVGTGRGAGPHNFKVVSEHEMSSKCITAWNAFRKGQTTALRYFAKAPIPKAI